MIVNPEPSLFSWEDVDTSPDLIRFRCALEGLEAEPLMEALERDRGGKRDDYPVRVVWACLLAGLFFNIPKTTELIRELKRNGELRQVCGMDPLWGVAAVPTPWVFGRFVLKLVKYQSLLEEMFNRLVRRLGDHLVDLAVETAVDSKALVARGPHDPDAAEGAKTQTTPDGKTQVTKTWKGYKLHLLCDARHEMPLTFKVTPADVADPTELLPLVEKFTEGQPELASRMETLAADRAYDDGADKKRLADERGILPLIPARDLHQGKPQPLNPQRSDTIYVSPTGEVQCRIRPFDPKPEEEFCKMQYQGFEEDRRTHKFRCPATAFGVECMNQATCDSRTKDEGFGRVVRVPLDHDRRLFGPIYGGSERFKKGYKGRTSIERLFFRMDHLYGFEHSLVRGLEKVRTLVTLGLSAMLATALGWIAQDQADKIRCRFQAA